MHLRWPLIEDWPLKLHRVNLHGRKVEFLWVNPLIPIFFLLLPFRKRRTVVVGVSNLDHEPREFALPANR